jgi:hypothetical protein
MNLLAIALIANYMLVGLTVAFNWWEEFIVDKATRHYSIEENFIATITLWPLVIVVLVLHKIAMRTNI